MLNRQVSFTEKTLPSGVFKALFFQDVFQAGAPGPATALRAFYEGDTYIALPGGLKIVDQVVRSSPEFLVNNRLLMVESSF
jgi:hypothetical protein